MMKRNYRQLAIWCLGAVNLVLLIVVVSRLTRDNTAMAQAAGTGDYLMIPGEVIGGNNAVVYVVDQTHRELSAMSYDDAQKTLVVMPARDMERDFSQIVPKR